MAPTAAQTALAAQPPPSTPTNAQPQQPASAPNDTLSLMQQVLAQQSNTQGLTQVGPQVPNVQQQPRPSAAAGVDNALKQAGRLNLPGAVMGLVRTAVNKVEERKQRETQKVFDTFSGSVKGIQDSQAQQQQAQSQLQQAAAALKANPQDSNARQQYEAAGRAFQQAQQAMQINRANLDDMLNGPKGEKNAKTLAKGFNIDDKNAGTPERQAAIQSIKKSMGVGGKAADILSRLPQGQQLTPQATGQQMARQAGVVGPPPTGSAQLTAATNAAKLFEGQANKAAQLGVDEQKIALTAYRQGMIPEQGADGKWTMRPMTPEEKGQYQYAQKGVLAWTMRDGKPVGALRNPVTNQIIPGTENPDLVPPSYMVPRIREGEFSYTDANGNVYRVPTKSTSTPVLPGATPSGSGGPGPSARSTPTSAPSTPHAPGRLIGQGTDPSQLGTMLAKHEMAPSELPGFGKARTQAIADAKKIDPNYDPAKDEIDYTQAKNPGVQSTLKYLDSLTGRDNQSGNLGTLIGLSDKIDRGNFPALNKGEQWAQIESGNPQIAAYHAAVVETADQIAKILQGGGTGSGTSDKKLQQASDILSSGFTKDQLKSVASTLRDLLANRKSSMIGDNPFLKRQFSAPAGPPRPANVPEGYEFKDGPKGKGWYKPTAQGAPASGGGL